MVVFEAWCSTKSWHLWAVTSLIPGFLSLLVSSTYHASLAGNLFHSGVRYQVISCSRGSNICTTWSKICWNCIQLDFEIAFNAVRFLIQKAFIQYGFFNEVESNFLCPLHALSNLDVISKHLVIMVNVSHEAVEASGRAPRAHQTPASLAAPRVPLAPPRAPLPPPQPRLFPPLLWCL